LPPDRDDAGLKKRCHDNHQIHNQWLPTEALTNRLKQKENQSALRQARTCSWVSLHLSDALSEDHQIALDTIQGGNPGILAQRSNPKASNNFKLG
jgi:hypothetical protein